MSILDLKAKLLEKKETWVPTDALCAALAALEAGERSDGVVVISLDRGKDGDLYKTHLWVSDSLRRSDIVALLESAKARQIAAIHGTLDDAR